MAADILITDASRVVVGVDQKQHIEFARNRAQAFNNKYGYTFTIPEYIESKAPKILNLRSNDKMSNTPTVVLFPCLGLFLLDHL